MAPPPSQHCTRSGLHICSAEGTGLRDTQAMMDAIAWQFSTRWACGDEVGELRIAEFLR